MVNSGGLWRLIVFYGEYKHNIDNKGRLIIPAKFRVILKDKYIEKFYVTRGLERCLFVFTENDWNLLEQKFKNLPLTQSTARTFSRLLFSGAYEATCDRQGRILIPNHLLQYAHITKEVLIIGVSNRIEIWDVATWEEFSKVSINDFERIAEELVERGI